MPMVRFAQAGLRNGPDRSLVRPHSATNLVVDDDRDVRELAVSSLENLGYQVLAAEGDRLATSPYRSG